MYNIEKELPYGFVSKKHLISFIIYIVLCLVIDITVIALIYINNGEGLVSIVTIIALFIQFAIGFGWLPFPIYFLERKFNKDRDYSKLKSSLEKYISYNINRETKNYIRLVLLRYAIIFELPYATKLLKDVYLPRKTTETLNVQYYEALFEFYMANGSHSKARSMIDAMAQYKVPKNIFNRYSLLYCVYMEEEVEEKELMAFNPVSRDFLERMISQFGLALYAKTNNDKEKFELYKKHINKACPNNPYFRQLTK